MNYNDLKSYFQTGSTKRMPTFSKYYKPKGQFDSFLDTLDWEMYEFSELIKHYDHYFYTLWTIEPISRRPDVYIQKIRGVVTAAFKYDALANTRARLYGAMRQYKLSRPIKDFYLEIDDANDD